MTDARRVIVDLSFPDSKVNIDIISVYGNDITYSFPPINDLLERVTFLGKGAWMWKADLSRAYRQLRVDLLATTLSCARHSGAAHPPSAACQCGSQAVAHLIGLQGFTILAYLNDYHKKRHNKKRHTRKDTTISLRSKT